MTEKKILQHPIQFIQSNLVSVYKMMIQIYSVYDYINLFTLKYGIIEQTIKNRYLLNMLFWYTKLQ